MKLYDLVGRDRTNGFSPFVWRTKLALAHKGIAFETVPLHFTNIKEVLKFADAKTVPILQDGENIITDSWDIACYLEDKYPKGPSLFGCDIGKSYAHLMHWQVTKTLLMPLFKVLVSDIYDVIDDKDKEYFRVTREPRIGCTIEEARDRREEPLKIFQENLWPYNEFLKSSKFLSGDNPAYNDFILYGIFQWANGVSSLQILDKNDPLYIWRQSMDKLFANLKKQN